MRLIRNPIPWPNGAKCACCLTFGMDADSLIHVEYPNDGHRRVSAISMLRYGPTVAVPRIVETYRRLGIRQTFFVPAWCIEQYSLAVEAILEGGHELAHHSYIHENPLEQTKDHYPSILPMSGRKSWFITVGIRFTASACVGRAARIARPDVLSMSRQSPAWSSSWPRGCWTPWPAQAWSSARHGCRRRRSRIFMTC
jgi:peptidoglycan/xylan/chitin deacetylase (PgdA/CDA1 family)